MGGILSPPNQKQKYQITLSRRAPQQNKNQLIALNNHKVKSLNVANDGKEILR